MTVEFFRFFYDIYDCDSIVLLKYTTLTEEVEINHDPLSTSGAPKKNKPSRGRNQPKLVRGREFSAIYEFFEEVEGDESLYAVKTAAAKLLKMGPKQRALQEEKEVERLKGIEDEQQQQPCRYVITKSWQAKWINFLNQLQDSRSTKSIDREQELLRQAFHLDGEEFIDTYIKGQTSLSNMPRSKREAIFDLVPAQMWYFFYFLYCDPHEPQPPPCIMLSPEVPNHVKDREQNRSMDASMATSGGRRDPTK